MSSAGGRGAFIVFEGCDRSGKTTTCQRLVQFLNDQSKAAKFMRFPDRSTRIGATIGMALFAIWATLIISTVTENWIIKAAFGDFKKEIVTLNLFIVNLT